MAQVIQLSFDFTPAEQKRESSNKRKVLWEFMGITMLEPTAKAGKNPCTNCWANGLCDQDECGRKLFPIDVEEIY